MCAGDELTFGERAADALRNGMGSCTFVFGALLFLSAWMAGNGSWGFDRFPFILLNLVLSCLAALQGAILLIASKRADQISSELATHDYTTNVEADRVVKDILALAREIHTHVTADTEDTSEVGGSRHVRVGSHPDDRELVMSCGAVVTDVRIALARLGYRSRSDVLPDARSGRAVRGRRRPGGCVVPARLGGPVAGGDPGWSWRQTANRWRASGYGPEPPPTPRRELGDFHVRRPLCRQRAANVLPRWDLRRLSGVR